MYKPPPDPVAGGWGGWGEGGVPPGGRDKNPRGGSPGKLMPETFKTLGKTIHFRTSPPLGYFPGDAKKLENR